MKLPSYLKKNGFDIYHFRIKVPKSLVKSVGKAEICRSLRTSCEVTARRKAQILAHEAEELFKVHAQRSLSDVQRLSCQTVDSLPRLADRITNVVQTSCDSDLYNTNTTNVLFRTDRFQYSLLRAKCKVRSCLVSAHVLDRPERVHHPIVVDRALLLRELYKGRI